MFKKRYILLDLNLFEAEFYHLPTFVPYFEKDQKRLDQEGFSWELSLVAMRSLVKEDNCDEYKLYKLYVRKWEFYQRLTNAIALENWADAEKIIDKILSIDLLDPSAYYNKAFLLRQTNEYKKSEQAYLKGLELVSIKALFRSGLAKTYEAVGKIEAAIYLWYEVLNEIEEKNLLEDNANHIFQAVHKEAIDRLIEFKVYRYADNTAPGANPKSFIEFAKSNAKSQAVYEQELPELMPGIKVDTDDEQSKTDLEAGDNFAMLMRKCFEQHYNDLAELNKLGITLVHYKLTALAVRVFERVYQLSQYESKNLAGV